MSANHRGPLLESALAYLNAGLSILPVDRVTKAPHKSCGKWEKYQKARCTKDEAERLFSNGAGIGIIGGPISGNVEMIDFDEPGICQQWEELLKSWNCGPILKRLLVQKTQSGHGKHVCFKHEGKPDGNLKLARMPDPEDRAKVKVRIETRGMGGYVVAAPTEGYSVLQGDWLNLPTISAEERDALLSAARTFDLMPIERPQSSGRVGDDYNERAAIDEILIPRGWQRAKRWGGGEEYWVRPGKNPGQGHSATYNWKNTGLFIVFSSSTELDLGAYDKFGLFARLWHGGDFKAAAKALSDQGYGRPADKVAKEKGGYIQPAPDTDVDGALAPETFSNTGFVPVELEYLWEPRLPKRKIVLFDADGGTQKTCLLAAIAAGLSVGQLPCGDGECEPVKTAYFHKGEDSSAEIATVFHANGGNFDNIGFFNYPTLNLDDEGIDAILNTVDKGKYGFIVLDALIYFCGHLRHEGWKDPQAILPALQGLAMIAEETNSTIADVRHTTKGTLGKAASELGFGSIQFRNSHRGQLVMRYSPAERGLVIVTDEKGSLLTPKGDAFAFKRIGNRIEYVDSFDNPFDPQDTFQARQSLRGLTKEWLAEFLARGPQLKSTVVNAAATKGIHERTLKRAFGELSGISAKGFGNQTTTWALPENSQTGWKGEDYDPYTDTL